jgi:diadenosine tetraphosphate (Ap4A) HIT family hydrolase
VSAVMDWDRLARGDGCPFDVPRVEPNDFWDTVTQLSVSTLCLLKNQTYRGHCILIYDPRHVVRPDQLTVDEWCTFMTDVHRAATALMEICTPDHLNVECLGNQMPHLHCHIIPRYRTDGRWSGPIWIDAVDQPQVQLSESEKATMLAKLRSRLVE